MIFNDNHPFICGRIHYQGAFRIEISYDFPDKLGRWLVKQYILGKWQHPSFRNLSLSRSLAMYHLINELYDQELVAREYWKLASAKGLLNDRFIAEYVISPSYIIISKYECRQQQQRR